MNVPVSIIIAFLFCVQVRATCKTIKSPDRGNITSPNYPNKYNVNQITCYYLRPTKNFVVAMTFHDFQLEEPFDGFMTDYLLIYDGAKKDNPPAQYFSGTSNPFTIVSKTYKVRMRFVSDNIFPEKGFFMSYEFVDTRMYCDVREHQSNSTIFGNCTNVKYGVLAQECEATCNSNYQLKRNGSSRCVDGRFESVCEPKPELIKECTASSFRNCSYTLEEVLSYVKANENAKRDDKARQEAASHEIQLDRMAGGRSLFTCPSFLCFKPDNGKHYGFSCGFFLQAKRQLVCWICRFITDCKEDPSDKVKRKATAFFSG